MRITIRIAQHGNSCRITLPPRSLQFLKWNAGTELQFVITDDHTVQLVDSETYFRRKFESESAAPAAPAPSSHA